MTGFSLVSTLAGCVDSGTEPGDDRSDPDDSDGVGDGSNGRDDVGESDDGNGSVVEEDPRVDEPPQEIDEPEVPAEAEYDEASEKWSEDYLGEGIDSEPSLVFEGLGRLPIEDPLDELDGGDQYRVLLVEDREELEAAVDQEAMDESPHEEVEAVDFGTSIVILVDSGYGSGSVRHRWVRAEEIDEGVHLHGYYTEPYERTADLTSRGSSLLIDRPESPDLARVSLTVSEDRRVHFNSTEGVVTVEE
jgi:hypothetical protein